MGFFTLRNPLKAPKLVMILMMVMIIIIFIPGFLKTGLEKISTYSASWQFETKKLIQKRIKSLYLTPRSKLMVPRSIPKSPNLKWRKLERNSV